MNFHTVKLLFVISVSSLLIASYALLNSSSEQGKGINEHEVIDVIRVGVVPAPPVSLYDASTNIASGHSIDIMNAISERSGIDIEYIGSNWATMGAALASKQVDIVIGPVFMTEARAAQYSFTKPIYSFAIVPVVLSENSNFKSFEDLDKSDIRVAVGRGGFDADFVSRFMPNTQVAEFPPDDPNLSMLEVLVGRADVAIVDFATATRFVANNNQVKILEGVTLSKQYAGFMLRTTNTRLKDFLEISLQNLKISGEAEIINRQYQANRIWHKLPAFDREGD